MVFAFVRQGAEKPQLPHRPYLTCGVPEEVTDVGDDFTEGQTLRSKPAKTTTTKTHPQEVRLSQVTGQLMRGGWLTRSRWR